MCLSKGETFSLLSILMAPLGVGRELQRWDTLTPSTPPWGRRVTCQMDHWKWGHGLCIFPILSLSSLPSEYMFLIALPQCKHGNQGLGLVGGHSCPALLVARWVNQHNPEFSIRKPISPETWTTLSQEDEWDNHGPQQVQQSLPHQDHPWPSIPITWPDTSRHPFLMQWVKVKIRVRTEGSRFGAPCAMLSLWSWRNTLHLVQPHTHVPPGAYPTHEASGSSHPPAETTLAGTEAGFPTKLFSLRESCWYHTAPLPPHSPPPAEVTPPPPTPQPFLFGSCSLPGFLLSLLQLSPVHHWKISLLPSFLFNNSGMSPKPLSQTDRPQHSLCWWHPEWKAEESLHFIAQRALQEIFFISPLKSLEMPRNCYSDSTQVLSPPLPSVFILYQWAT